VHRTEVVSLSSKHITHLIKGPDLVHATEREDHLIKPSRGDRGAGFRCGGQGRVAEKVFFLISDHLHRDTTSY
jgi:hypothetical protein